MLLLKTIDQTYFTQIIYLMSLKFLCNTCVIHIPPFDPDKRRKSWEIRVYQKYSKSGLWLILGRPPPPSTFLLEPHSSPAPCACCPSLGPHVTKAFSFQPAMPCSDPTETSLPFSLSYGLGGAGWGLCSWSWLTFKPTLFSGQSSCWHSAGTVTTVEANLFHYVVAPINFPVSLPFLQSLYWNWVKTPLIEIVIL